MHRSKLWLLNDKKGIPLRKADRMKTEVRVVKRDPIDKCDAVYVEEAEYRKKLPGKLYNIIPTQVDKNARQIS